MDHVAGNKQRPITKLQAKAKVEHFCAYQERCQQEVRDKLFEWGLPSVEVEDVIADLILDSFINEERFTKAYVSGKFRLKGWGKIKINRALKQKRIPTRLIQDNLKAIDPEEYYRTLIVLLEKKAGVLQESDTYKRKNKLLQYALGKGYEQDLIFEILSNNNL